jgi:hypothetical protein
MSLSFVCTMLIALQGVEAVNKGGQGLRASASGFVRSLEFNHRLRVCNAYPYAAPLDLFNGHKKLTQSPMPYKACEDFASQLKAGDKLEFRVGDSTAGTFSVADLPNNDAILLLLIHRHDTLSTAVSFESHVFANLLNAQVAVLDTYKGSEKASMKIRDASKAKASRSEELRFDSVVAVNPGEYEVALVGSDGATKATTPLVALNRESYIVMRTGVESQQGQSYPQEVVVFPKSQMVQGSAYAGGMGPLALLAALFALCQ